MNKCEENLILNPRDNMLIVKKGQVPQIVLKVVFFISNCFVEKGTWR